MLLVSELVISAVKYGGEGPVEIVVDRTGGRARFVVRDHGGPGPLPAIREPGTAGGGSRPAPGRLDLGPLGRRARLDDRVVRLDLV